MRPSMGEGLARAWRGRRVLALQADGPRACEDALSSQEDGLKLDGRLLPLGLVQLLSVFLRPLLGGLQWLSALAGFNLCCVVLVSRAPAASPARTEVDHN